MVSAVVTGGAGGIGLGIVRELVAHDYNVSVLDVRAPEPALAAALGERVHWQVGDIRAAGDRDALVTDAVERWGGIDVLVNNAGIAPSPRTDVLEVSLDSYDRVMDVNLRGPFALTQQVARHMVARPGRLESDGGTQSPDAGGLVQRGVIINIGSANGTMAAPERMEYCVSKAGVAMLTKVLAVRLASEGVRVHLVVPGLIATDMTAGVAARYDAMIEQGRVPMPRWGTPRDVARAVRVLASGELGYSTGLEVQVDGGLLLPVL